MRKEIFFAVIFGLIVGLVVTYGIYTANQALSQKQKSNPNLTNSLTPSPLNDTEPELTLSVSSPQDGIVVSDPEVKVEGTTLPNAMVAIITDDNDLIVQADENGVFQQSMELIKGANTIKITVTDFNTTSLTKVIELVYSTEVDAIPSQ
ncbi:hypothetical protein COX08_03210 [Candidatus Beckwithbacteria bacterium CG23_combo_of_CG06-09_8_20_14_all_34_8]|uniref:Bacterial Ig domain-containing protein n=1 Tax=Candidatus Beckwithbacteria bacterium CG23_combo_of_CG06-09_8_20_14_all_34_8 TaxID=1974497 RepID=A0A2H0B5Y3_9BACT|nr:MAG: hypothetical protein COX08_03210 [Candidatus Beckwithbacteria bacterium CG23_combo_of_CG06-09_8_20_14_all_34_8]